MPINELSSGDQAFLKTLYPQLPESVIPKIEALDAAQLQAGANAIKKYNTDRNIADLKSGVEALVAAAVGAGNMVDASTLNNPAQMTSVLARFRIATHEDVISYYQTRNPSYIDSLKQHLVKSEKASLETLVKKMNDECARREATRLFNSLPVSGGRTLLDYVNLRGVAVNKQDAKDQQERISSGQKLILRALDSAVPDSLQELLKDDIMRNIYNLSKS